MEGAIAHNLENGEFRTSDVAVGKIKSFCDIHQLKRNVLKGLQRNIFVTPTGIQAAAIPIALTGMDLLIQSKSGTGKTLIYVVAAMQILNKSIKQPQVLIIVPTRELAIQVESIFHCFTEKIGEPTIAYSFIGGTDVTTDRQRMLQSRIVIGTLGRLLHLCDGKTFNMSEIKMLVLDEADQLYMTNSSRKAVDQLIRYLPKPRQIITCSATYENNLDEHLAKLMLKPILISNTERATVLLGIRQFVYELPSQINGIEDMRLKVKTLQIIFNLLPYEQAILFANSLLRADSFNNYINASGIKCELISGALSQSKRLEAFEGYRQFTIRTLVSTDLMARGVDSSHANLVINLDVPRDHVNYLHRIGRAGRFGSKGIAITLLSSSESIKFKEMLSQIGTGVTVLKFPQEQIKGFNIWDFDQYKLPYYIGGPKFISLDNNPQNNQRTDELPELEEHIKDLVLDKSANDKIETKNASSPDNSKNGINIVLQTPDSKGENKEELSPGNEFVRISLPESNDRSPKIENDIETPSPSEAIYTDYKKNHKETILKSQTLSPMPLESLSIDMPPAAPNSINTKTYCLVVPTEPSSTTLQPLGGVSNTVDDASSIISDSMECGYSSDSSYISYYDSKDERLIWSHFKVQQKLMKRHKLSIKKRNIRYTRRLYIRKSSEKKIPANYYLDYGNDNELDTQLMDFLPIKMKGNNFRDEINDRPLLTDISQMDLLKKFKNWQNIQHFLNIYIKRRNWSIERSWIWLNQLNDAVHQLYYMDTLKSVKSEPNPESKDNKPLLMDMLNEYKQHLNNRNVMNELKPPMGKLSVHIAHQLNIPSNIMAPAEPDAAVNDDNRSESNSSFNEPNQHLLESSDDGDESIEPNSSSGFDERNESASSGIDTSKYDTDSTDHYQFVDDDDEDEDEYSNDTEQDEDYDVDENLYNEDYYAQQLSNESLASMSSEGSNTASSDDNNYNNDDDDDDDDDDDEDDKDDNDIEDIAEDQLIGNGQNVIAEAQSQWHQIFNMQYQFIASYVNSYMALAHPDL